MSNPSREDRPKIDKVLYHVLRLYELLADKTKSEVRWSELSIIQDSKGGHGIFEDLKDPGWIERVKAIVYERAKPLEEGVKGQQLEEKSSNNGMQATKLVV